MSRTIPAHGTTTRRRGNKSRPPCLCRPCVLGARRENKRERIRREQGITGEVPAAAAAAHVRRLIAAGRTIRRIADEAGVDWETVRSVAAGERPDILRRTSDKLKAVCAVPDDAALIDATGTVRRVRALIAMGHPQERLSAEIGCSFTYISSLAHGRRPTVTVALARNVRQAYERLSMLVGPSARGRLKAQRLDWNVPLAWDDDTIDDPKAVPQTDADEPIVSEGGHLVDRWLMGESVVLGRVERGDVLVHLFEWSELAPDEIAARLDMTASAASRAWERHKEKAREAGGSVPWRRRYALRNKELTANEMGAAA